MFFGSSDKAPQRKVVLVHKSSGTQVIPKIESWKNREIQFMSPPIAGIYEVKVDDGSGNPISNGVDMIFGLMQKEVSFNFTPIFGGTRLEGAPVKFYLGPRGGSTNLLWRTVHARNVNDYPRLLYALEEVKVIEKAWSKKENSLYDVFVKCELAFNSATPRVSFDNENILQISIPYTMVVNQRAESFLYNKQIRMAYKVGDSRLSNVADGTATIRIPVELVKVANQEKLLSQKSQVTLSGTLVLKDYWPSASGLNTLITEAWERGRIAFAEAISDKFASNDYRMSVFANELTGQIYASIGNNARIIRVETTAPRRLNVYYLE